MKNFFTLVMFLTTCTLFAQQKKGGPQTDANRVEKVKLALPAIEKMFSEYAEKNHFPGLAFGIVVDGELAATGGYGYSNIESKTKASSRSLFRIASMTKSVTAMGILALRNEGKLKLDDPVALYIKEAETIKGVTTDAPPITIRHLMTHMAGFPEDNPWGDRQLDSRDEELLALIKNGISFSNVPGTAYEYSNLGFAILGRIITQLSGKPYQDYINEKIFKPLGMKNTFWEYTEAPAELLAHGYRFEDNVWKEEELLHDGTYGAMGGLITSVEDFSRYMAFHLSVWPANSLPEAGPVKRADVREMQQPWNFSSMNLNYKYPDGRLCPMVSAYGYGLRWSKDCENRVAVGHTGGLPGFGSQWQIFPDYGIGIVGLANRTYAGMSAIDNMALDSLLAMTGLKPRPVAVSSILNLRKNELVKLLPSWNNAERSGIFAENFFPDKSVAHRKKESDVFFSKIGELLRVGDVKAENQLRGTFNIDGKNGSVQVYFTLSPENPALIQYLDFDFVR